MGVYPYGMAKRNIAHGMLNLKVMLIGYTAINRQTGEKLDFYAYSSNRMTQDNGKLDAYNWIVNHLDVSYQWDYFFNGKFKHEIK